MKIYYRPIERWPRFFTADRVHSRFATPLAKTQQLLSREVILLGASSVVVQMAISQSDFRVDGAVRASARPQHPGVIVSFTSRHGPLQYVCDTYIDWADNLRAVTLSLEALRRVDRYGVVVGGEQYTGFVALPAGGGSKMDADEAAVFIAEWAGDPLAWRDVRTNRPIRRQLYRVAAKALHPDVGGQPEQFRKLQEAFELLEMAS